MPVFASHDATAHDWCTGTTDPVLHSKCCGDRDCHPIGSDKVRETPDGYYVRQPEPISRNDPPTGEWFIPKNRVQAAPDDHYHICEMLFPAVRIGRVRMRWMCFFAPRGTS
jgi:hypothetical protein